MDVRSITAAEARLVRLPVLRDGLPPESAILPRDDESATRHFGAFDGDRLVAVATFFPEACSSRPRASAWRLRGMATVPDRQRKGAGRALIDAGVRVAKQDGAILIWCHARVGAQGFYEKMGFIAEGPMFDLAPAGKHYVMVKELGTFGGA
jgi:GNAT superfamily N-acetyltransferase